MTPVGCFFLVGAFEHQTDDFVVVVFPFFFV